MGSVRAEGIRRATLYFTSVMRAARSRAIVNGTPASGGVCGRGQNRYAPAATARTAPAISHVAGRMLRPKRRHHGIVAFARAVLENQASSLELGNMTVGDP